jgi:peptidyl-prolyl cis-trans isomerase D
MQKRDYAYTQIPALKFVDKVDVKEAEIQSFYNKHQDIFLSPEMLSVKYVQLSMPSIKEQIQLDEKEIRQYYNDHQTQFMLPAQWDLENIVIGFSEQATQEEQARALKFAQKLAGRFQKNPVEFVKFAAKLS